MPRCDVEQLNTLLTQIASARKIKIHGNLKNRKTRWRLGITVQDQIEIVRSLTVADWVSGPEDNYDTSKSEPVWKFKKRYLEEDFYIKLYIDDKDVETMSCHISYIEI